MEQQYLNSSRYMQDIGTLIHVKIHESFKARSEADVLKSLIESTKADYDATAERIEKVQNSSDPTEKKEHKKLSEQIVEKWAKYKYYFQRRKDVMSCHVMSAFKG